MGLWGPFVPLAFCVFVVFLIFFGPHCNGGDRQTVLTFGPAGDLKVPEEII